MKKLTLTGLVAAGVLLTTACSEDNTFQPQPGEGGNVTFTIQLPAEGLGSRAFNDGKTANTLEYAVYDAEGNVLITKGDENFAQGELTTTVSLSLANGKAYNIAFFAHDGNGAYTFNAAAKTFTVNYAAMTAYNSADYDAFFALKEVPTVTAPVTETVTLTRPLAQINWGTSDLEAYNNAYGTEASNLTTKVSIDKVYTTFNMLDGTLDGETKVEFAPLFRPLNEEFPVENYEYLSMNYVLVPAESSLVEAVLTPNNGTADLPAVTVANMPVQANYRTNIYGALLTSPANITVVKEPNFNDGDFNINNNPVTTEDLEKGGRITVNAETAEITIPTSMEEELTLILNAAVDKIVFPKSTDRAITIEVAKDVAWPQFVMPGMNGAIKDLTVKGDLTSSERCTGFDALSVTDQNPGVTTIENLTFSNVPFTGAGVNVGFTANPQTTKNITIENCDFINLEKPAFNCSNNKYEGTEVGDIFIRNNTISINEDAPASTNGIYICESTSGTIEITGNTIKGGSKHGIMMSNNKSNITITDNTFEITGEDGIKIDHPQNNITIKGNTVQAKEHGIRIARFKAAYNPRIVIMKNAMDMSACKNPAEYYAIYLGYESEAGASATVIAEDNIKKAGECKSWFKVERSLADQLSASSWWDSPFID